MVANTELGAHAAAHRGAFLSLEKASCHSHTRWPYGWIKMIERVCVDEYLLHSTLAINYVIVAPVAFVT